MQLVYGLSASLSEKRPLTGLLQHSNLISWGRVYFYSCLSILKNAIASSHCVEGWSHVCACDRVPVHSVFKADPIKQTEPGHGRIAWKRVGEGWRGMERDGEGWSPGPWGEEYNGRESAARKSGGNKVRKDGRGDGEAAGTGSAVSRQCLDPSVKIYGNNIHNYILNQKSSLYWWGCTWGSTKGFESLNHSSNLSGTYFCAIELWWLK